MPTRPRPWLALATPLVVLGTWGGMHLLTPRSPEAAFEAARTALEEARHAEAPRYAPEAYVVAEVRWDTAFAAWRRENARLGPLRDYTAAAVHAAAAAQAAVTAAERARGRRQALADSVARTLPRVQARRDTVRLRMRSVPHERVWAATVDDAVRLAEAAAGLHARGDHLAAAARLAAANASLDTVETGVQDRVRAYLASLPTWQAWRDGAVAWSAQRGAPAIVVDKMARRLLLYDDGRLRATYTVDLGPAWMGPKRRQGDRATPEGRYRVIQKLGRGATIYHRALLIDYPNAEDWRRFAAARASGLLPADAAIGGNVEIHGAGGRGADWTDGCVALADGEMEALFGSVPVGTPVVIVGALTGAAWLHP